MFFGEYVIGQGASGSPGERSERAGGCQRAASHEPPKSWRGTTKRERKKNEAEAEEGAKSAAARAAARSEKGGGQAARA